MANLSELREGLHVSVSQVKTYLRCPRQYFFRYVVAAEPEFVPRNLVLGSAVHEGLAAFYRSVMETSESPEQDVGLAALHATLEAAKKNRVPLEEGEDDLEAVGTGAASGLLRNRLPGPAGRRRCRGSIRHRNHDPVTGEVLEERLGGRVGPGRPGRREARRGRAQNGGQEVEPRIKSSTTSSCRPTSWWRGKLGLGDVGLRLQILTKTRKPAMVVENTERGDRDIQDFMATVVGVLRAVDAGVFYPVRTSMCGGCAFQRRCTST